jgi:hypothetical protein
MATNDLILAGQHFQVGRKALVTNCEAFLQDPTLQSKPYTVRSRVSPDSFGLFVDGIGGAAIAVTSENVFDLELLCAEFDFAELAARVSSFLSHHSALDLAARRGLSGLADHMVEHDRTIVTLQGGAAESRKALQRVLSSVEDLRRAVTGLSAENRRLRESNSALADRLSELEQSFGKQQAAITSQQRDLAELRGLVAALGRDISDVKSGLAPVSQGSAAPASPPHKQFTPASGPLRGIIAHLTGVCGGNVDEKGVVWVTSKGNETRSSIRPRNAVDLGRESHFFSSNGSNQWICYDFVGRRVRLTYYSIHSSAQTGDLLKSWEAQGSVNGQEWTALDRQAENNSLREIGAIRTFQVAVEREVRMVRLMQTGMNHVGTDSFAISGFELFGDLLE